MKTRNLVFNSTDVQDQILLRHLRNQIVFSCLSMLNVKILILTGMSIIWIRETPSDVKYDFSLQ
jgi:hypothetical protein